MTPKETRTDGSRRRWLLGAAVAVAVSTAGLGLAVRSGVDPSGLLGEVSGRGRARVFVDVGAVASRAGGDVEGAAREGVEAALADRAEVTREAGGSGQRGARAMGRGHVIDANVQAIDTGPGRARVSVSVVVSTYPGRAYEFESSSTVTVSGSSVDTPAGRADAVRRAMRSATDHAVDQMLMARR